MAANKIVRLGPVALTNVLTTNVVNPPTLTGGAGVSGTNTASYLLIKHIRIVNKTGSAATFTLYIGASAGNVVGTEFLGLGTSVAANSYVDYYGNLRLDTADFIVGGSNTTAALTLQGEAEIGIAG